MTKYGESHYNFHRTKSRNGKQPFPSGSNAPTDEANTESTLTMPNLSASPSRSIFTHADRAHGEAEVLRAQAKDLLTKAEHCEAIAIAGWAQAEADKPMPFTAVFRVDGKTHCEDCNEGLYAFLDRVRGDHPNLTEVSITISLN